MTIVQVLFFVFFFCLPRFQITGLQCKFCIVLALSWLVQSPLPKSGDYVTELCLACQSHVMLADVALLGLLALAASLGKLL